MSKAIQKFVISHGDPVEFCKMLLSYGAKGAWLPDGEYAHFNHYPKHVKLAMVINSDEEIVERSANILSFDPVYDAKSFTEEELEALEWSVLKELGNAIGVSHRDRAQLIRKYIERVGEPDEAGEKVEIKLAPAAKVGKKKVVVEKPVEKVEPVKEVVTEVTE